MANEIWNDIPGYEGYYQVSNLGNVKSLSRIKVRNGFSYMMKEKILRPGLRGKGYFSVLLSKDGLGKSFCIHRLIMVSFIGVSELHIDHINSIKTDNRLENLEYVTNRENVSRSNLKRYKSSKYTGVSWYGSRSKWCARIKIGKVYKNLGYFEDEELARDAYNTELKKII